MRGRVLLGTGIVLLLCLPLSGVAWAGTTNGTTAGSLSVSAYTCTAVSTIAQTGPASLTTVGSAVCSLPVQQEATSSIGIALLGTLVPLSSQSATCGTCATIAVTDTATVVPTPLVTYLGQFRDVLTSLPGTTIVPGGGCSQFGAPNQALCVAESTYTFPA